MTGTFPAAVIASNKNIVGTDGPAAVNQIAAANPGAGGTSIDQGAWATPYNMQVGPTRYAPMQPVPPTKITKVDTAPLWPTSSVRIATTFLPVIGTAIVTTQTQPQTYSAASHANTVSLFVYIQKWLLKCPSGRRSITSSGRYGEVFESMEGLAADMRHCDYDWKVLRERITQEQATGTGLGVWCIIPDFHPTRPDDENMEKDMRRSEARKWITELSLCIDIDCLALVLPPACWGMYLCIVFPKNFCYQSQHASTAFFKENGAFLSLVVWTISPRNTCQKMILRRSILMGCLPSSSFKNRFTIKDKRALLFTRIIKHPSFNFPLARRYKFKLSPKHNFFWNSLLDIWDWHVCDKREHHHSQQDMSISR